MTLSRKQYNKDFVDNKAKNFFLSDDEKNKNEIMLALEIKRQKRV